HSPQKRNSLAPIFSAHTSTPMPPDCSFLPWAYSLDYLSTVSRPSLLLRVSVAMMKHQRPKAKWGSKGFIWLVLAHCGPITEVRKGTQAGQEPEGRN
ncbi:mCG1040357, partial [Mus musculus]